jgi:hypothetical protein
MQTRFHTLVTGSITRPANTTAYTAADALTDSATAPTTLALSGCVRSNGGTGEIHSIAVVDSSAEATKPDLDVFVFSSTIVPTNDNAAFAVTDAELRTCVAHVALPGSGFALGNGNGLLKSAALTLPFRCASSSTSLHVALVVRNAYTPVSAERFDVILGIAQD